MLLLISQVIFTILTTIVSIIQLKKDERSRTESLKKEASIIKQVLFFVAGISLFNSGLSYYSLQKGKEHLDSVNISLYASLKSLRADNLNIRNQNTDLRRALSDSSISQSKLIIASQQKSAYQLNKAALNLSHLINGTDSVPVFSFTYDSTNKLTGVLRNAATEPAFNIVCSITNFTKLQKCELSYDDKIKAYSVTNDCYSKNNIVLQSIPVIEAITNQLVALSNYEKTIEGKYLIHLEFQNASFVEEAIFSYANNQLNQSTRILELSSDRKHIKKSWIARNEVLKPLYQKVNWEEDFPNVYVLNLNKSIITEY